MKMEGDCKMREESAKGFDPGFKLFGKTIPVGGTEIRQSEKASPDAESENLVASQSCSRESIKDNGPEASPEGEEEVRSSIEAENEGKKPALKKPDKLLPCPRCESMDTKFCYYNNYNVNQPRHFCKNCQRYWTAGGTLRNVPVGAGRRKNKNSAAASAASSTQYRQIRSASDVGVMGIRAEDPEGVMIPCSLPAPCVALGGSRVQVQVLPLEVLDSGVPKVAGGSTSGSTVLNFGPGRANRGPGGADCEPMEWRRQSRDEISCGSSVTAEREIQCNMNPAPAEGQNPKWPNGAVPGAAAPFFAGPWPFGWNFAAPGPWGAVPWPMVAGSPLGAWPPAPWITAPWAVPAACNNPCDSAVPETPTLGKRPQSEPEGKQASGSLWVPKTLRIDDPGEAAKSSFWTTLGLGDKPDSTVSGRVMFKAFQPKTEGSKDNSPLKPAAEALRANPAAFSRSVSFQESN